MLAYVGFFIDIHDSAAFSAYARAAAPTYGKFPSMETAHARWDSDEYRRLAKLRKPPVADSRVFFVDGIDIHRLAG
jgi:uncharacterized protein (DUF1330 family)